MSPLHQRIYTDRRGLGSLLSWGLAIGVSLALPIGAQAQPNPTSPTAPSTTRAALPDSVATAILRQTATTTGRPFYNFRIADAQPRVWPDGCLGLGQPGMVCAQVLTDGWQVVATDGQQSWNYRSNSTGSLLRSEPPLVKPAPALPRVKPTPAATSPARPPLLGRPVRPGTSASTTPTTAPAPESRQQASAQVQAVNGRVTLVFVNKTNAAITYQAVDDTNVRSLPGKATVTLQSLTVPATVTFRRQDGGLLNATPRPSDRIAGQLIITLDAAYDLSLDRTTVTIEASGDVFLN